MINNAIIDRTPVGVCVSQNFQCVNLYIIAWWDTIKF